MRFIVVPISIKQSLVFCQRTSKSPQLKPRIDDRLAIRALQTWNNWSKSDKQWKKTIVNWANLAMERINYHEWSLKSIPRRDAHLPSSISIPVEYPNNVLSDQQVSDSLHKLAQNGLSHHRKYFWLSLIGAPLTLPVAAVPLVPNLPGFYLLFRVWSHWKAYDGAENLMHLLKNNQLQYINNYQLSNRYANASKESIEHEDRLLLDNNDIDELVENLNAQEMGPELHRALKQVKKQLE